MQKFEAKTAGKRLCAATRRQPSAESCRGFDSNVLVPQKSAVSVITSVFP